MYTGGSRLCGSPAGQAGCARQWHVGKISQQGAEGRQGATPGIAKLRPGSLPEKGRSKGCHGCMGQLGRPPGNKSADNTGAQPSWRFKCPCAGQGQDEGGGLITPPPANLDCKHDQPASVPTLCDGAPRRGQHQRLDPHAEGRDKGCKLLAPPQWEAIGHDLQPPIVDPVNLKVQVRKACVGGDSGSSFSANACGRTLQRTPAPPELHDGRRRGPEGDGTGRCAQQEARGGAGGAGGEDGRDGRDRTKLTRLALSASERPGLGVQERLGSRIGACQQGLTMPTGLGGCSLALPATKEGGRPLLLHHGRALTSRQLPPRRGSKLAVGRGCRGGPETLAQHEASGDSKQPSSQPRKPKKPARNCEQQRRGQGRQGTGATGQRHGHVAAGRLCQAKWKGQTTRLNHGLAHTRQWSPGEHAKQIVATRTAAKEKEQPRSLQMPADAPATGHAPHGTGEAGNGDTEHCEPLFFNWPAAGTNPTGGLRRTWLAKGGWRASGQVPNACLATVETHWAVGPELICKVLVSKAHSVRPGNGDRIVKEGHEQLVGLHLSVRCFQGSVLAEGVESGHQGITLLPPFRSPPPPEHLYPSPAGNALPRMPRKWGGVSSGTLLCMHHATARKASRHMQRRSYTK